MAKSPPLLPEYSDVIAADLREGTLKTANISAGLSGIQLAAESSRFRVARWYMQAFAAATAVIGVCAIAGAMLTSHTARGSGSPADMKVASMTIAIPQSVQIEHAAIHSALIEATKAPGPVGQAARALAEVLHPHFVREEQIALPPLGLLARLAGGTPLTDAEAAEALGMTDSLRRELPQMLDEHKRIRKAVEGLRAAAQAEHAVRYEQLAAQLALHAQSEEEVLYPAAVLVGEVIRAQIKRD